MASKFVWLWDASRKDHYYVTIDPDGKYNYHYKKPENMVALQSKIRAVDTEKAVCEIEGSTVASTPPPAYTPDTPPGGQSGQPKDTFCPGIPTSISTDRYAVLTAFLEEQGDQKRGKCTSLFRSGIMQIMAETFSADFPHLQAVLTEDKPQKILCASPQDPNSILSQQGQAGLGQLCALVQRLASDLRRNRWPTVCRWEKLLLIHLVLKPAQELNIPVDYALELFGRYKCSEFGGPVKTSTMLDYWTPSHHRIRPKCTSPMLDLGDTLASHALLIEHLPIRDEKMDILEAAFATFSKNHGMDSLRNSKELNEEMLLWKRKSVRPEGKKDITLCLWPVSDDYYNLFNVLRGVQGMDKDMADSQREKLRRGRKMRSYFQFLRY
jgi:hypothetical protein